MKIINCPETVVKFDSKRLFNPDDLPYGIRKITAYELINLPEPARNTIFLVSKEVIPFIPNSRADIFYKEGDILYRF